MIKEGTLEPLASLASGQILLARAKQHGGEWSSAVLDVRRDQPKSRIVGLEQTEAKNVRQQGPGELFPKCRYVWRLYRIDSVVELVQPPKLFTRLSGGQPWADALLCTEHRPEPIVREKTPDVVN